MKKIVIRYLLQNLILLITLLQSLYAQQYIPNGGIIELENEDQQNVPLNQLPQDKYFLIRSHFQQCSNCMKLLVKHLSIYKKQIPLIVVTDYISDYQFKHQLQTRWQEDYQGKIIMMNDLPYHEERYILKDLLKTDNYPVLLLYCKSTDKLLYCNYHELFAGRKMLKIKTKAAKQIYQFYAEDFSF